MPAWSTAMPHPKVLTRGMCEGVSLFTWTDPSRFGILRRMPRNVVRKDRPLSVPR
jgi:hypothetical protein